MSDGQPADGWRSIFALDLCDIRLAFEIDLTDRIETSIALDDLGPEHRIASQAANGEAWRRTYVRVQKPGWIGHWRSTIVYRRTTFFRPIDVLNQLSQELLLVSIPSVHRDVHEETAHIARSMDQLVKQNFIWTVRVALSDTAWRKKYVRPPAPTLSDRANGLVRPVLSANGHTS